MLKQSSVLEFNWQQIQHLSDLLVVNSVKAGNGCVEWNRGRNKAGYGVLYLPWSRKIVRASRVSYRLFVGPIPDGLEVLHGCDNPPCIRPSCLTVGTHAENMSAMKARRRHGVITKKKNWLSGELLPQAKLSDMIVFEIIRRARAGETQRAIASSIGVHQSTVWKVVNGKSWLGVEPEKSA